MPEAEPDIPAVVDDLWPRLRAVQVQGRVGAVIPVGLGLMLLWLAIVEMGPGSAPAGVVGVLGVCALIGAWTVGDRTRRRHEGLLMPHLAGTLGLTYVGQDRAFLDGLPPRLLPEARHRKAEDLLTGQAGGREIRFAEVLIETGARGAPPLFDGVVMEVANAVPMPVFFVAPEGETRAGFLAKSRIAVQDLVPVDRIAGKEGFGIWSTSAAAGQDPALRAVVGILTALAPQFGPEVQLYSALSDGTRTWVAIRQPRDLFRIGGLFASRDRVLADIARACQDMAQPLRIVQALLAAEEKAGKR